MGVLKGATVDAGAEYRACKQAVVDARMKWADAERVWVTTRTPAKPQGDPEAMAAVEAAVAEMNFAKCCVIAAGETFKGQTFAEITGAD